MRPSLTSDTQAAGASTSKPLVTTSTTLRPTRPSSARAACSAVASKKSGTLTKQSALVLKARRQMRAHEPSTCLRLRPAALCVRRISIPAWARASGVDVRDGDPADRQRLGHAVDVDRVRAEVEEEQVLGHGASVARVGVGDVNGPDGRENRRSRTRVYGSTARSQLTSGRRVFQSWRTRSRRPASMASASNPYDRLAMSCLQRSSSMRGWSAS